MSEDAELERIRAAKFNALVDKLEKRREDGLLLVECISKSLAAGTIHRDVRGNLLTNVESVLNALLRDGHIYLEEKVAEK